MHIVIPASLDNYTLSGTYSQTLAGGGTANGNILIENSATTGCNAPASSSYDFDRTVVLNMTEAVNAPSDLAAFKATDDIIQVSHVVSTSWAGFRGLFQTPGGVVSSVVVSVTSAGVVCSSRSNLCSCRSGQQRRIQSICDQASCQGSIEVFR